MLKTAISGLLLSVTCLAFLGCSETRKPQADKAKPATARESAVEPVGQIGEAAKAAPTAAPLSPGPQVMIQGMPGGPAKLAKIDDFFKSAGKVLQEINDVQSAKAALPKLKELSGSTEGLATSLAGVPEVAVSPFTPILTKHIDELKDRCDKVTALPGVEAVVKPAISELMGKLRALLEKKEKEKK